MQFTLVETFNKTDCSKCMVGVCIKWPDAICTYSKLRYQVDLTQIFEYWAKHVNSVYKSLIWKNRNDVLFAQELCCRGIYCGNRRECFSKVDLRLIDDGMVIWTRLGLDQVFVEATLPDVVEFKSFVY